MNQQAMGSTAHYGAEGRPQPVMVKFFTKPVANPTRSAEEGRPIFDEKEHIEIRAPGQRDYISRPIRDTDKQRYAQQYAHWKDNNDNNYDQGMPLSDWPQITRSQAEELKFFNCHTVEQLAAMTDNACQNHVGILRLKQKAADYVALANDSAPLAQLRKELEEKDAKLDALTKAVEEQSALIAQLQSGETVKRKPGRPKKVAD